MCTVRQTVTSNYRNVSKYECSDCMMSFPSIHSLSKHRQVEHTVVEEIVEHDGHVLQGDITAEELSILPKDVVTVLNMEDVPSQDILEVRVMKHPP